MIYRDCRFYFAVFRFLELLECKKRMCVGRRIFVFDRVFFVVDNISVVCYN